MKKTLLSVAFLFATIAGVNAQQTISFEASEGFTLGDINGQQNWTVTGAGPGEFISSQVITNALASDGTYSLKIANDSDFGYQENGPIMGGMLDFATPIANQSVSFDVYISDTEGNSSDYRFSTANLEDGVYITTVYFQYDGAIIVQAADFEILTQEWLPNTWYNFRIETASGTVTYYMDNVQVFQGPAGANATGNIDHLRFVHDNYSPNGLAYIDNIKLNEAPASVGDINTTKFSIYPNPANDVINVSYADAIENVTITDMNGRIVKQVVLGVNEAQINISDLSQGVYILNASANGKSITEKIVKK